MSESAEEAAIARSPEGVSVQEMTSGWRVIIARHGERCATWYYHEGDDRRLMAALTREAERRLYSWKSAAGAQP